MTEGDEKDSCSAVQRLLSLFACGAAHAAQPVDWQTSFQPAATDIMEQITWFEHYTLWFIVPITLLVLVLLAYCIVKFRASVNPTPSRTSHNTLIEVIWTVGPVVDPAVPRRSLVPAADRAVYAAGRSQADGQGDRQPVELGLRVPGRGPAFLQLGDAARRRPRRLPARKTRPSIRVCSPSTTRSSFRSTPWSACW